MASPRDKKDPTEPPGEERAGLPEAGAVEGPAAEAAAEAAAAEAAAAAAAEDAGEAGALEGGERAKDTEPWWASLEPLPPLDQILPEHIAYVRLAVSRFSVTPTHWREDLVQEILIEAHRSRDSRLDVRALLFGITRHVVFRWMAKRDAERTAIALHPERDPITNRSIEDDWAEAERREAVRMAIDELPDIFREVFVRTEIEHMTMPKVARELGIPVNTGYTRLYLARARFLESLHRILARRRIQKQDLSVPIVIGAAGALQTEGHPDAPAAPEPPPPDAAPEPPDAPGPADAPVIEAGKLAPRVATAKAGSLAGAAPWIGGGLVAAAAVAVSVWIATSPDAEPNDTTPTAEPPSTIPEITPDPDTSSPDEPTRAPGPPSTTAGIPDESPPFPGPSDQEPASPDEADAGAPDASIPEVGEGPEARWVVGLANAGRRDEALQAAEVFRRKYPASVYDQRILEALARVPPPPDGGAP